MVVRTLVKCRDRPRRCRQGLAGTGSKVICHLDTLHAVRSPVTLRGSGRLARDHAERVLLRGFKGVVPLGPTVGLLRGFKGVFPLLQQRVSWTGSRGSSLASTECLLVGSRASPVARTRCSRRGPCSTQTKPPVASAALAFPCERADAFGGFVFGTLALAWPDVNRRSQPTVHRMWTTMWTACARGRVGLWNRPGHWTFLARSPCGNLSRRWSTENFLLGRGLSEQQPLRRAGALP